MNRRTKNSEEDGLPSGYFFTLRRFSLCRV
nr:MAG TPA: hypothetical protein [Bacteriophage sp.]